MVFLLVGMASLCFLILLPLHIHSAGKSFVAEILMLRQVLSSGKIALLVLPYVSLCAEKVIFVVSPEICKIRSLFLL